MATVRTTAEVREGFLSFYEEKGHLRRPSASLIPRVDDRSTLYTSAGMQPQMPYFLGREAPPAPLTTTCQKCFRTPDIDEVGLDTYHLTFFEMLGNFSFGRYFKEGAIEYATEFIRERLQLDWDRVWVSVHAGDAGLKLGPDEEAIALWEQIGMPSQRIVPLPSSENFWSVGGPGPCGPDSEMYWDWGQEVGCAGGCLPGCSRCERFLEFGNLVFMSYELHPDGTLTELPSKNIDTGWGLERVARVVQDVASVYDTDGYQLIMDWVAGRSGVAYGETQDATKAHRVLADHGRGMTFIVAEGVTPSNEGRGYVLRRIVRRAAQHGLRIGMQAPFLPDLADVVIEQMGHAYPELVEHREEIHRVLAVEEQRFGETLERGMVIFEEAAAKGEITGEDAFTLHATYGFPLELTQELARERGLGVNDEEFTHLMAEHQEVSRQSGTTRFEPRFPDARRSEFVGYEQTDVLTSITALADLGGGLFQVKLEQSPFYPAGGGQVTDAGWIEQEDGSRAELVEALRLEHGDQELVFEGSGFGEGDRVRAVVPWGVRYPTTANHTATHLLHKALQEVLGEHVKQAGSAVRPDKLRFDFTHPAALSEEEREAVESRVNEQVFANLPVRIYETPLAEARNLGAMMLFGEKYGEVVRVVDVDGWSLELCGGTHVRSTAEIGPFTILREQAVGAGARRIEAVTAGEAFALLHERAREADGLRDELAAARREAKQPRAEAPVDVVSQEREDGVLLLEVKGLKGGPLRDFSDRIRQQEKAHGAIVASRGDGRVYLVVNFDESLVARGLDAVQVVRELGRHIGGGGGGKPTLAEAGGKKPDGIADALAAAKGILSA